MSVGYTLDVDVTDAMCGMVLVMTLADGLGSIFS